MLLSWNKIKNFRVDKILYGYQPEKDMPYAMLPYLINDVKQCRRYLDGIGFQTRHEIMILEGEKR